MRMHFPCERPKALPEGRNSPLLAYEAINQTIMNKGVIVTRDWCPEEDSAPITKSLNKLLIFFKFSTVIIPCVPVLCTKTSIQAAQKQPVNRLQFSCDDQGFNLASNTPSDLLYCLLSDFKKSSEACVCWGSH